MFSGFPCFPTRRHVSQMNQQPLNLQATIVRAEDTVGCLLSTMDVKTIILSDVTQPSLLFKGGVQIDVTRNVNITKVCPICTSFLHSICAFFFLPSLPQATMPNQLAEESSLSALQSRLLCRSKLPT